MLSKNNYTERLRKMEEKNERFSIRKFSAGAASVLIGFSFMNLANSQTVKADTQPAKEPTTDSDPTHVAKADNTVSAKDLKKVVVDQASSQENNNKETENNNSANTQQEKKNNDEAAVNNTKETTNTLDTSSIENAGAAGRAKSLTESKADANALTQDAKAAANKEKETTKKQVSQDDLRKTATETINYTAPDGVSFKDKDGNSTQTASTSVTASATRTGNTDTVTGETTYSDWTYTPADKNFAETAVTKINGYTPSATSDGQTIDLTKKDDTYYIPSTPAFTKDGDPIDKTIDIKYTADQAKANIKFIDNDDKSKTIYTQTVTGVTGQVNNFSLDGSSNTTKIEVPAGWHLVGGQSYKTTLTLRPDTPDETLYIESDNKENSRTINYVDSATQKVVGTQTVTGKVGSNQTIGVDGKNNQGQKTDLTFNVPTGYEIVPNTEIVGSVSISSNDKDNTAISIPVQAKRINGTTQQDNPDLFRKVTETIQNSDNTGTPGSQTIALYRDGVVDPKSGRITPEGEWKSATKGITDTNYPEYEINVPAGYNLTAKAGDNPVSVTVKNGKTYIGKVSALDKDGNPTNVTVNFTLVGKDASQVLNYVEKGTSTVVGSQTFTGKTGDKVNLTDSNGKLDVKKLTIPKGWQVANGTVIGGFTIGQAETPVIEVEHAQTSYNGYDHQDDPDVYKLVSQTITYNYPSQDPQTIKNSIAFTRNKVTDDVTGKSTYTDWKNITVDSQTKQPITGFAKQPVATIAGYSASAKNSDGSEISLTKEGDKEYIPAVENVTADTPNQVITVDYQANSYTYTINYVTKNDNQNVGKQEVTGQTGQKVDYTLQAPTGYDLIADDEGKIPTGGSITFGSKDSSTTVYVQKHDSSADVGQPATQVINFVDTEDNNKLVESRTLNGKIGDTQPLVQNDKLAIELPKGYVQVSQSLPKDIVFAKDAKPIEIKLAHEKTQETWENHQDDANYHKVITETITYTYPSQAAQTLTNKISYVRNGLKDAVTGKTTYTDWTAAKDASGKEVTAFKEVSFPAIKGYTAVYTDVNGQTHTLSANSDNKVVVPAVEAPVDGPSDYKLSLAYNNDKTGKPDDSNATYTYTINYVTSDKQNVGTQEVTGKNGDKVSFSLDGAQNTTKLAVPDGYEINGQYPSQITFSPNMQTSFDVVVQKKSDSGSTTPSDETSKYIINFVDGDKTVATATLTGTVGSSVDIASKVKVPDGYKLADGESLDNNYTFTDQDVTKNIKVVSTTATPSDKVNVTVNYIYEGKNVGNTSLSVSKGKSSNITGFVKANVPTGYKVNTTIPAQTFNQDTTLNIDVEKYDPTTDPDKDTVVTQVINYVADGTTVKSQNLTGKVGTAYKVVLDGTAQSDEVLIQAPEGYKLSSSSIASPIVLQKQAQPLTIPVTPIVYSGNVPADAQKYPELAKTVNGIYKYNILGKVSDSGNIPVSFYRTGSIDPKTGKMTYTSWKSNMSNGSSDLPAVSLNTVNGYTIDATASTGQKVTAVVNGDKATISGVSMLDKDGNPTDVTVNVDYINNETGKPIEPDAKDTTLTLELVDGDNVITKQTMTGLAGSTAKINLPIPDGYKLADGVTIPTTHTFANQDETLTYQVVSTKTTDPDQGNHGNSSDDQTTEVKQVINYVDQSTNKVVATQTISGKSGTQYQPILKGTPDKNEVLIEAPKNYSLAKQSINPITLTAGAAAISIFVVANTTPENYDQHKDDPNYNRTITQTVTFNIPNREPITNTYHVYYYRNAVKNDATGEITYDKWQVAKQEGQTTTTTTIPSHDVSLVPGYTPVVTDASGKQITLVKAANGNLEIPAMDTTPDSKDVTYTVNYSANTLKFNINYVDMANNKVINTQVVSGEPGKHVNINSEVPENWQLVPSDKAPNKQNGIPTEYTFGNVAPKDVTVYIEPKVVYGLNNKDNPDYYKTVTGNVTVTMPGQEPKVENTTSLTFYRDATYNPATNKYDYSAWKANTTDGSTTFGGVILPEVTGYKISVKASDGQTITPVLGKDGKYTISGGNALASGTPEDVNVEVSYTKDSSSTDPDHGESGNHGDHGNTDDQNQEVTQEIQYISDGKVVKTDKLTGKVGTSYKVITEGTPQDGQVLIAAPQYYTWSGSTNIPTMINLSKDAQPLTFNVSPITYYGNSEENKSNPDMYKQVTGTYDVTLPGGTTSSSSTSLAFYRDRSMDPATGTWKYTDWKSNVTGGATTFAPMANMKVYDNYTIKVTTSTGQEVTPTINGDSATVSGVSGLKDGQPTDVTINIDYINDKTGKTDVPVDPNATYNEVINYVTKDGQNVGSQTVSGKANQTVNITLAVPDGYQVVSGEKVPASVTFGNSDLKPVTVTVEKKADPNQEYTYTINYDYQGKSVGSQVVKGKQGQQVNYTYQAPENYQLVPNSEGQIAASGTITFGNQDQSATVQVQPKTIQGNVEGNQDNPEVYRKVTITYNVTVPAEKTEVFKTSLEFYRDATYNPATDKYDYTAWKSLMKDGSTTYGSDTVPVVTGYTIQVTTDNGQKITPVTSADGKSAVISGISGLKDGQPTNVIANVDYINDQTGKPDNPNDTTRNITINYVYNDQTVGNQTVSGKVGEKTTYTFQVPENYQLIPKDGQLTTGGTITFGIGQAAPITVQVQPKTIQGNVEGNQDNSEVYRVVTGKFTINIPGQATQTYSPTLTFYRDATYNPATGKYDYTAWKSLMKDGSTTFPNVPVPNNIEGYTLQVKSSDGQTITPTVDNGQAIISGISGLQDGQPRDIDITVDYINNSTGKPDTDPTDTTRTFVINYIDKANNQNVGHQDVTGKVGEKVNFTLSVPSGYQIVGGQSVPAGSITFGSGQMKPAIVYVEKSGSTNPDNPDSDKEYTYTINYSYNGNAVDSQVVKGKQGQQVSYTYQVPENYQLVPNSEGQTTTGGTITFGNQDQATAVQVEPKTIQGNTQDNQNNPDFYKTVTITYDILGPNGKQQTVSSPDSLSFYRNSSYDPATNKYNYSEWKSNMKDGTTSFGKMTVPVVKGYSLKVTTNDGQTITPVVNGDQAVISGISGLVNNNPENVTVKIEYINDQTGKPDNPVSPDETVTQVINYVADGKVVGTQTVTGKAGTMYSPILEGTPSADQVLIKAPDHYTLAKQSLKSFTLTKDAPAITIPVEAKTTQETWNNHQDDTNYYRTITQTVTWNFPGQQPQTRVYKVIYFRNGMLNEATGQVTYDQWQAAGNKTSFAAHEVSLAAGYTPVVVDGAGKQVEISKNAAGNFEIPEVLTTPASHDMKLVVNYTPDEHKMVINYVNSGDKQVVSTQTITGKTGQKVDYKLDIPTNWEIVPGTMKPSGSVTFGSSDLASETVMIRPQTISGNTEGNQDNPEVYREVSDTVIVNYPGKQPVSMNASLAFYRTATIDPATGKWTYSSWESNMKDKSTTFPSITVRTIDGYTIAAQTSDGRQVTPLIMGNSATISGVSGLVNGQPQDVTIVVNYKNDSTGKEDNPIDPNAKLYTYTINYMDGSTKVGSQNVTGPQGVKAQITANIPKGYKLADGVSVPTNYTFQNRDESINISVVKDSSSTDNPDKGQTTTISGLDDKSNPDLYREITQTITITDPTGKTQSVDNHLIFYRDKTTNNTTGKSTYTDWKSNSADNGQLVSDFGQLEVPTVAGYDVVASENGKQITLITKDGKTYLPAQPGLVDGSPDSRKISISYVAQSQSVKINFVDSKNQVIATQTVSGKTGEKIQLKLDVPEKWQLVPNTKVPTSVTLGTNDNKDINIAIEHKLDVVDGRNEQSDPNLFKEVTRTIIMNWPGQAAGKSTASLAFYRIKTTDEVTNETTYTKWESATKTSDYPEQSVALAGYTASAQGINLITKDGKQYVPATAAAFNSEGTPIDSTIVVNYTGDKQEVQINYVDNGKTVSTQTITGQIGITIAIPLDIPSGYEIANGASYPTQITFGKDTKPMSIDVAKIPNGQQKQTINYVDSNNQVVGSQYVVGTIGSTVDVQPSLPINWKLADGASVPTSVTIKDTDTPIVVKVVSDTINVSPSDPKTPGTQIDNAHGQTYPNGLTADDLNKTVTRTVNIVDPVTNKTATTVQTVKFTRTATVQVATGEVTYGDWTADGDKDFKAIEVPEIPGYTASGKVSEIAPSPDYGNQTLTITYTKNGSSDDNQKPDNEKYKPEVGETSSVTTNGKINPEDVIKNADKLPEGTKFEWTNPDQVAQDLTKPGTYKDVGVKITYPDKTSTTVTTTIVVSDKQEASYIQEIIFEDSKTKKPIRSFKFTGPLTDGKAVLSADKLKSVIESLFKVIQAGGDTYKNATIVSLPTKDVEVTGGENAPIIVMVGFENEKPDDNKGDNTNTGDNTSDNNSGSGTNTGNTDNTGSNTDNNNQGDSSSTNTDNGNSAVTPEPDNSSNNSGSTNSGSDTTNNSESSASSTDTTKDTSDENTSDEPDSDTSNSDEDNDNEDYGDEDNDETPSKTSSSHLRHHASSGATNSQVRKHANDAQWLANHGYIVTVGIHGQVIDYTKSPDGKGAIITAQVHGQTANISASTSALQKAGLSGVKNSTNSSLPQTGDKDNDAAAIGLGLVSAAGLLGLAGAEKKRKRN